MMKRFITILCILALLVTCVTTAVAATPTAPDGEPLGKLQFVLTGKYVDPVNGTLDPTDNKKYTDITPVKFTYDDLFASPNNGSYIFAGLRVGKYKITEVEPENLLDKTEYFFDKNLSTIEIEFEIREAGDDQVIELKNIYNPMNKVDIPVKKTWLDNNNRDKVRPQYVRVHLFADGVEVAYHDLVESENWEYTFTGQPATKTVLDADGVTKHIEAINYTLTEDVVPLYTSQIFPRENAYGYDLLNTYDKYDDGTPDKTSTTVAKIWDDNNDEKKMRPTSIVVTCSNGMTAVLSAENNWTVTVNNLPVTLDGKPVTYTWKEQEVLAYRQTGKTVVGSTTTFTNKYSPKNTPEEEEETPTTPGEPYTVIEGNGVPLGVEVIINHVGDCFD